MENITLEPWQIWVIAGIVLVIIEILTPAMFFLNLALACFATAVCALFLTGWPELLAIWVVFSGLFLWLVYPLLTKKRQPQGFAGGMDTYIGKKVKVIEKVTAETGAISIYDERWNARSINDEIYDKGTLVTIDHNDNLIMYVRKEN